MMLGRGLIGAYVLLTTISWTPFPWMLQWSEVFFVVVVAYAVLSGHLARWRFHSVDLLVVGYLLGSLPSFVATSDLRVTAVAFAKHLYLVAVYVVFTRLAIHRQKLRALVDWLGIAAVVTAGVGLVAAGVYYASGVVIPRVGMSQKAAAAFRELAAVIPRVGMSQPLPYLGSVLRLYGPFHSPEMFASFLAFTAPIVVGAALTTTGRRRACWWLATAGVLIAAGLTVGHALGGLGAALLVVLWRVWAHGWYRPLRAALLVATAAFIVVVNGMLTLSIREVHIEHTTNPRLGRPPYGYAFQPDPNGPPMTTIAVSYNWMAYYLVKKIAWETFRDTPLTGVGLGRFHETSERAVSAGELHALHRIVDPHSTLLGRLAETGIVGGATLVLLLGGFVWLGVNANQTGDHDAWRAQAVLAGVVGLLVNSINVDVMNFRFLWLGLAVLR
ncbi:MAG: hypothetical protein HY216_14920, partial [Candidatus Rokubacteria bacterium]|nr:hypothetical protein [Candidatus Rokubacteria bacterium]